MTNKRKHVLERTIRNEYKQFETMLLDRDNSDRIITQLFNLLYYKIEYLFVKGIINYEEKVFMKQCRINYTCYYHKMVAHIYKEVL